MSVVQSHPSIERVRAHCFDRASFAHGYLAENRPVVLSFETAHAIEWCARWSPTAIASRYADATIEVEETREVYVGERTLRRRPLGAWISGALAGDTRERWKGLEFLARVPAMRDDLAKRPPPFDALMPDGAHDPRSTLWIAPARTMSSLHHDGNFDNLNLQVSGRKTFLLVPPPQHRQLYRYGSAESPINPFAPDLKRFPRFAEAAPQVATLTAGEALLIPKYWWHCVFAHEPSVNLATCFSWKGERSAWSVLAGAPLHHRALTVVAAELKKRGFVATADATRRLWLAAYERLVPRVTPQPRALLEE